MSMQVSRTNTHRERSYISNTIPVFQWLPAEITEINQCHSSPKFIDFIECQIQNSAVSSRVFTNGSHHIHLCSTYPLKKKTPIYTRKTCLVIQHVGTSLKYKTRNIHSTNMYIGSEPIYRHFGITQKLRLTTNWNISMCKDSHTILQFPTKTETCVWYNLSTQIQHFTIYFHQTTVHVPLFFLILTHSRTQIFGAVTIL
jgi:hypothetical protein